MTQSPTSDLIPIMHAALAPVTVISGAGLLLSSMTTRYGRTSDRIRNIAKQYEEKKSDATFKDALIKEISILFVRQRLIRIEIICVATAIFCVALTIFFLFTHLAYVEQQILFVNLSKMFFLFSLVLLLISMTLFIIDVLESLQALKANIEPYPELKKATEKRRYCR